MRPMARNCCLAPDAAAMVIYGRNAVREGLRGRRTVRRIWATGNAARETWLRQTRVPVVIVGGEEIERHCGAADHQGVCAEISAFRYSDPAQLIAPPHGLLIALDQIQDPQNLGAICRSAECAGVRGVVIPERRSAEITPAVCKASAGGVEHLAVARVRNLADFLTAAKAAGIWCYGADVDASLAYDAIDYSGAALLVLGSEGRGLRPRVAAACDALVAIPIRGQVQSLNVSAAAAVLIYAARRALDTGP